MKARELVELLKKHDPESDVYIQQVDSRGSSPVGGLSVSRVSNWDHRTKTVKAETFLIIEERYE